MNWTVSTQAERLTRREYRQPIWLRFVLALLWPAQVLMDRYTAHRTAILARMRVSSQTLSIERYLQDLYGPGVYIEHRVRPARRYIYRQFRARRSPMVYRQSSNLFRPVIYRQGVLAANQYNFAVYYPAASPPDLVQLAATLRAYIHTGFTYQLISY